MKSGARCSFVEGAYNWTEFMPLSSSKAEKFSMHIPRKALSSSHSLRRCKISLGLKCHCTSSGPDHGKNRSFAELHGECYAAPCAFGHTEIARDQGSPNVLQARSNKKWKKQRLRCRKGGCARASTAGISRESTRVRSTLSSAAQPAVSTR